MEQATSEEIATSLGVKTVETESRVGGARGQEEGETGSYGVVALQDEKSSGNGGGDGLYNNGNVLLSCMFKNG